MTAGQWMREGTALFDAEIGRGLDLDAPSALPGWSRRHVVAHVAFNARALQRLLHWARTGEETRMYPSPEARGAEIDAGAALAPARVRELYAASRDELDEAVRTLPDEAWGAEVVTAQGRRVPASEVLWMRTREVWIHAVDLGGGASFEQFPAGLTDALIDDVTSLRRRRGQAPGVIVTPSDRDREWRVEGPSPHRLSGTAAEAAAVLTGRAPEGPDLGGWL